MESFFNDQEHFHWSIVSLPTKSCYEMEQALTVLLLGLGLPRNLTFEPTMAFFV